MSKKKQKPSPSEPDVAQAAASAIKGSSGNGKNGELLSRMPKSQQDRKILRDRADELAKEVDEDVATVDAETFIRFRLGVTEQYGITHDHAREIIKPDRITPIPCTPPAVMGIVNRRGDLLTVLDLKQLFQMESTELTEIGRIVVVGNGNLTLGIYADEILGENGFDSSQLADPLPSLGVQNIQHVKGIFEGKVTVLDMEALLGDEALMVDHKN